MGRELEWVADSNGRQGSPVPEWEKMRLGLIALILLILNIRSQWKRLAEDGNRQRNWNGGGF